MNQTFNLTEKYKLFVHILFPILITQVGLNLINFVDTMMSGRAGANDLAGVAIGSSLWVPVYTGLSGILVAITPIIAQYVGAKQRDKVPHSVMQGVYISIVIAIVVAIVGSFVLDPILDLMKLESEVREIAKEYIIGLSFGIVPLFVYSVLRSFIDALGHTRVSMIITLSSLPINVLFNYLLIFGKFGFPQLGGAGAGYATAITYWLIVIIAVWIILNRTPFVEYRVFRKLYNVSLPSWGEILKLGLPIGFAIFFETSIFSAVTLLMSEFNTITIAAHQVAINFSSLLYMIPLSISMALTIVVGFEVGANRFKDAKQYSVLGICIAVVMALVCAMIIFVFQEPISKMYSTNVAVIELTTQFLIYAIFFQLSDAIAAPIQGALRGYKDVNTTFVMTLISYWVIGLPVGYVLAQYTSLGAFGYWIGLIVGLAAGAITLSGRLLIVQKKVARINLNEE
ncbi:MATE family efflux transporter [Fredinandcohnia sp. QZ13]|uniref:MATE family efflux transporter n=1 Tax=Fredinandcohnia sp. QZ13 TaxID=3073144 RepID=UPI0028536FE6|nr:MATE family efflux transporter [Fredinandcohnia sp. QZ13]MDR4886122.1 MATE family efflux transporter [Fredinandcohnia sp. QZ13]